MRGARDADLVRFGEKGFFVGAGATGTPRLSIRAGFERATRHKKIVLDGVEVPRLSDALGALPCVAFAPADVEIVVGAPGLRRRFLDVVLASTSRPYLVALQHYRSALVRRNAALRSAAGTSDAATRVGVWEVPMARHGAVLWRERTRWVEWARSRFAELCAESGESETVDLRYRSSVNIPAADDESVRQAIAEALVAHRDRDLARGLTHAGPHRDDLDIRLGAHAMRAFGSAGQQRTAAIALRLLERRTYIERTNREPVVLLDDPFAELDTRRAARILALLTTQSAGQAIFAVPRAEDIPAALTDLKRFHIAGGAIV
jgi:DNA replication and repair protein RecF